MEREQRERLLTAVFGPRATPGGPVRLGGWDGGTDNAADNYGREYTVYPPFPEPRVSDPTDAIGAGAFVIESAAPGLPGYTVRLEPDRGFPPPEPFYVPDFRTAVAIVRAGIVFAGYYRAFPGWDGTARAREFPRGDERVPPAYPGPNLA